MSNEKDKCEGTVSRSIEQLEKIYIDLKDLPMGDIPFNYIERAMNYLEGSKRWLKKILEEYNVE